MKRISSYILEKFKISKNTRGYEKVIDMYHKDDLCLHVLWVQTTRNENDVFFIEGIQINKILSDTRLKYTYITDFSNYRDRTNIIEFRDSERGIYFNNYTYGNYCTDYIIPRNIVKSFIEDIMNNDNKITVDKLTGDSRDKRFTIGLLGEQKNGATREITQNDFKKLLKKLNL